MTNELALTEDMRVVTENMRAVTEEMRAVQRWENEGGQVETMRARNAEGRFSEKNRPSADTLR